ncbi:MAG: c-type cytochrome [Sphingobacteriales bacterium]|jgi:cytochrome c553
MRKVWIIKINTLKLAALVTIISAVPSLAGELANANVRNCTWCHGPSAQGYAPAPRLAGQRPLYIVNQIRSYNAHRRDNPFSKMYMWPAAANVGPQAARYLANYLSALSPEAANDGNRELVATGRAIYQEGIPDLNIAACVACHGPRGQGIGEIPRLGGLSSAYLQERLQQWRAGYDAAARHPMPHVASNLSSDQIAAVASYLSFIK